MIDKGTDPNFTLTFDGTVIAAPYNPMTLSGSTGVLSALPLGLHVVTVHGFNMFGAVTINVNFTIDDPIVDPRSTVSAVETVSQRHRFLTDSLEVEFRILTPVKLMGGVVETSKRILPVRLRTKSHLFMTARTSPSGRERECNTMVSSNLEGLGHTSGGL